MLAMQGVGAMICAGGCRGRTLCRHVVDLRTIAPICVRVIFYFHTDYTEHTETTEFTEAHGLRVLALRGVGAMICAGGCRGRTLCRPVVNLRTINPICVRVIFNFHTDFTELTETHWLRVLALRDVCAMRFAAWLCVFCEVCVKFKLG